MRAALASEQSAPATSSAKRTQRVQWMHRVMTVFTSGPRFLSCAHHRDVWALLRSHGANLSSLTS